MENGLETNLLKEAIVKILKPSGQFGKKFVTFVPLEGGKGERSDGGDSGGKYT